MNDPIILDNDLPFSKGQKEASGGPLSALLFVRRGVRVSNARRIPIDGRFRRYQMTTARKPSIQKVPVDLWKPLGSNAEDLSGIRLYILRYFRGKWDITQHHGWWIPFQGRWGP